MWVLICGLQLIFIGQCCLRACIPLCDYISVSHVIFVLLKGSEFLKREIMFDFYF